MKTYYEVRPNYNLYLRSYGQLLPLVLFCNTNENKTVFKFQSHIIMIDFTSSQIFFKTNYEELTQIENAMIITYYKMNHKYPSKIKGKIIRDV